jgi:hypothetical protein
LMMGCVGTPKYQGVEEILTRHPQGSVDARDASPESKEFLRDLLLYINQIEYELERPR